MIRVNISGIDALLRNYDRKKREIDNAITDGTLEAAEYLQERIEEKFGKYQGKGGSRGGAWAHLKYETIAKKIRMGNSGNATKPLVNFGDMMFSFVTQISNRTRKHTVTVISNDEKLAYHVYGAPRANVPRRDPVRPTAKEERDKCIEIIEDAVREVL